VNKTKLFWDALLLFEPCLGRLRLGSCLDFSLVNLDLLFSLGFPLGCVRVAWTGLHQPLSSIDSRCKGVSLYYFSHTPFLIIHRSNKKITNIFVLAIFCFVNLLITFTVHDKCVFSTIYYKIKKSINNEFVLRRLTSYKRSKSLPWH